MDNLYPTYALSFDGYIVEIDGKFESEYGTLMAALKAGLGLRQKFPHSQVRVHDANDGVRTSPDEQSAA